MTSIVAAVATLAACASPQPVGDDAEEPTQEPAFIVDEQRIGDPDAGYFSLEISPDMRFVVWQEILTDAGGVTPGPVWSCGIDPLTAELLPSDGRGFRVDDIPSTSAPQWGEDERGAFFVTIDAGGEILLVRPTASDAATVERLTTPADPERFYPYPTRDPERAAPLIAFLQNDDAGRPQIHVVDALEPEVVRPLTSGPVDFNDGVPSFVLTVFRWFPGTTELAWGYNDAAGRLQVAALHAEGPTAEATPITDEEHDHIDSFPAVLAGERLLVGGIDRTSSGAVYRQATADAPFRISQPIDQPSAFAVPMMAASFEPFAWEGEQFASYIVLDGTDCDADADATCGRAPGSFPAETWLVNLGTGEPRLLSSATTLNRMDPEYFLGEREAFVLFYARPPTEAGFRLYRARTGLARP